VESSQLPLAVELHVALLSDRVGGSDDFDVEDRPGYTRRVVLPVRPIDLRAMLESEDGLGRGGSGDGDGDDDDQEDDDDFDEDGSPGDAGSGAFDEDGEPVMSVAECVERNRSQLNAMGWDDATIDIYTSDLANLPAPQSYALFGQTIVCY
ncbi:MAG: hypothetical protein O7A09_01150, partial [Proteobacteria bacterium]|nr:hypothetical protein [Pseudomonadota bacterium]